MVESFIQSLGVKKLFKISFGLFVSIFLLWTLFNAYSFVPEGMGLKATLGFLGYGLLGSYTFSRHQVRSKLSQISLLKAMPIFLFTTFVSFVVLGFFLGVRDPLPETFISVLIGLPVYIQLSNAFIFATVESSFWQGWLDGKIGILGSSLVAGFFHMIVWPGPLLFNFIGATFLFFVFSQFNRFFSKRWGVVVGLVMTIGVHTGYNLVKYKEIFGI